MEKKKTLSDFVGILKTEGEYDFEEERQHAKDYVTKNYIASEINTLIDEYDFPLVVLSDINNRLRDSDDIYYQEQQLRYLKNLVKFGKVEKK